MFGGDWNVVGHLRRHLRAAQKGGGSTRVHLPTLCHSKYQGTYSRLADKPPPTWLPQ